MRTNNKNELKKNIYSLNQQLPHKTNVTREKTKGPQLKYRYKQSCNYLYLAQSQTFNENYASKAKLPIISN